MRSSEFRFSEGLLLRMGEARGSPRGEMRRGLAPPNCRAKAAACCAFLRASSASLTASTTALLALAYSESIDRIKSAALSREGMSEDPPFIVRVMLSDRSAVCTVSFATVDFRCALCSVAFRASLCRRFRRGWSRMLVSIAATTTRACKLHNNPEQQQQ